jgi:very-short-patch-repair endonuclease
VDIIPYNHKLKERARELRRNSTLSEVLIWNELKQRKLLGFQFHRQKPILNYIVDFYCRELKLVIEIDGEIHKFRKKEDMFRQEELETVGLVFIRFTDDEVRKNIKGVMIEIGKKINMITSLGSSSNSEPLPSKGECPPSSVSCNSRRR